jgi:catechol 2,3-dioxygenase-like lactoylglutathione lyase family enzyme
MRSIIGLDHVVLMVRDLDEGARRWTELGFTVSPRGLHTAVMGTANHTIMLRHDYIELIGVVAETERNLPGRQFLARRGEGMERAAFTGTDADDGVAELTERGFAALGPYDFGRPVDLPDGRKVEARFRTFVWPVEERPGGLRIFACQHLTRDHVWIPELTRHANTAYRIDRVEMLSPDPAKAASHMGRLIDRTPTPLPDGAIRVETGSGRGDFVFLDRATLDRRHPGVGFDGIPEETPITLALTVSSAEAAAKAVGSKAAVVTPKVVKVPPAQANGIMLELSEG